MDWQLSFSSWKQVRATGFSILQMEALRLEEAVPEVTWLVSGGPGPRLRQLRRMGLGKGQS